VSDLDSDLDLDLDLDTGRRAYDAREWQTAYRCLGAVDRASALGPADLWRLAVAAYLTGRDDESLMLLERAHHAFRQTDDVAAAVRCAFWLGLHLAGRGELGPATGWFGRATRLVEGAGGERVERGYVLIPVALGQLEGGDPTSSYETAGAAAAVGERFGDADLQALAIHLQGLALLGQGRVREGLGLLDEAMVGVAAGETSPMVTGLVYCSVLGACRRVYALGRAWEWTTALNAWCDAQPDLVPYRGQCRVYRAEILQLRGEWAEALAEAERAAGDTGDTGGPSGRGGTRGAGAKAGPDRPVERAAVGAAHYQRGEVHRLRGELGAAEAAYRAAREHGREPQPGLALLRLAQGDVEAATGAIRRVLAETADPLRRARLLPAAVEIALAAGDVNEARQACAELEEIASVWPSSVLDTVLAHARGAAALAAGDALGSLVPLRQAVQGWQAAGAPYEAARVRALLAEACRALGDGDTARLEREAARGTLLRLGAAPDLARLDGLGPDRRQGRRRVHGLTARELEVLALLATGRTNRAIAGELFISEKTVARHVSNIFAKLGLPSRAAATAYAYEHDLVQGSPPARPQGQMRRSW
jgi:DNA-binding CsgD family transcriptional regulator/tetratricopeptide (TPR) repeat protein